MFAPFIREKANDLGPMMAKQEATLGAKDLVYVISKKLDERDEAPDENGVMVKNANKGKYQVFLSYMNRERVSEPGAKEIHYKMTFVHDENNKAIVTGLEGLLGPLAGGDDE